MMKRRNIIMVMMTSLLLGSCSSDDILSVPNGNGRIRFDVGVSQSQDVTVTPMNGSATRSAEPLFLPTSSIEMHSGDMTMYANCASTADIPMHNIIPETTTRGTEINTSNFYNSFGLFGYFYDSAKSWDLIKSDISPELSMKNLEVTRDDNSWTTDVYWPGGTKRATFFAYAPYDCQGAILESNTGAPKITYTVPSEIANQKDLLVAKSDENISCNGKSTVALNFQHALTAIKFTQGDLGDYTKITSITISGVKNKGELSLDGASWDNVSTTDGNTYTITSETGITLNDVLLLLMPQELPNGAQLLVTMSNDDGTNTKDFSANLTGVWQKGYTVTYQLSVNKIFGDYVLEITPNKPTIGENGGDVSMTVKSYFEYSDGSKKNLPWTASYAYADGTDTRTPIDKALTITSASNGSGSTTGETLTANIARQYLKSQYNFNVDENLKTKAQNSASPFDLSTYNPATGEIGTGKRSANCYIIKAPGYYKLPLVFGNTLNNLTNANGNGSKTFKDANDTEITSENISGVNGAKLLWQDEYGLIEPSSIRVADNYLYFEIKEGSITQGNALIAATSGKNGTGDILWSWHIWVTDADFQNKVKIYGGASLDYSKDITSGKKEFNFMKMPLGFCNSTTLKYPERKIVATIIQTGTSYKKTSVIITQTGSSSAVKSYGENCTFYQWGRKDPFPGSDGNLCNTSNYNKSTPKYCYDADGNSFEYKKVGGDTSNGKTSKGGSIKNPYTFYYSKTDGEPTSKANDWCNETTDNNWSSNVTDYTFDDTEVVKSLYDPCPIGFKVPETTCFTGFTNSGDNVWNNSSYYNVISETYKEGWSFYTTDWRSGTTDFWRAFGFIDCWVKRYDDYTPLESRQGITGRGFLGWSGLYGYYWSARAYSGGYGRGLHFNSGHVGPRVYYPRVYGFSVRPVSE